ncbi:thioredoxin fold domain-containing protein [Shewanella aestuarii]|uniref:Thiol:disulfide interchange protein n=1 Tax=Shewanella aestuarii TaxID=1028752 RepID=A0A6G9QPV1_9GAMM|nr:thioredoxin fold domain-containing protein [Shewanella aestuarii]QIR16448.1 thioredoxin fold domain-containing protein [Shewanella aestuarii]
MNSKLKLLSVAILTVSSFTATAVTMTQDAIKVKFETLLPFGVTEIKSAPIDGFYQIETEKGIFYASNDGQKIFSGSLHKFEEGLLNLTALRQQELTSKQLDELQNELIVYQAPNEKYFVTVFTDPTCGYCRKLHHEMKEYNDLGITIAYAAYPRGGVNSDMANTLNNIWCSENQLDAMNKAKSDIYIPTLKCQSPVAKMYNVGSAMGINGTPALFLPNGELVPGYQPPKQLLMTLENQG